MEIGIQGTHELTVTDELLANKVGSGLVAVFATPMMIAGMEYCAAQSVQPFVGEGKTTVGMQVSTSHEAATPLGMKVRFESELTELSANGKILTFRIAAYDEAGLIGQGTHQRAIISTERFEQKAKDKLQA